MRITSSHNEHKYLFNKRNVREHIVKINVNKKTGNTLCDTNEPGKMWKEF